MNILPPDKRRFYGLFSVGMCVGEGEQFAIRLLALFLYAVLWCTLVELELEGHPGSLWILEI